MFLAAEASEVIIFIFLGLAVGAVIAGGAAYILLGAKAKAAEAARGDALKEVEKLKEGGADGKLALEQARIKAQEILQAAQVEARAEALKLREKTEADLDGKRDEIKELEKRVAKREESIEQKIELLDMKADQLEKRGKDIEESKARIAKLEEEAKKALAEQRDKLAVIAQLSQEEAKRELLERFDAELVNEKAERLTKMFKALDEQADEKAKWTISQAICRLASEYTGETTTSTIEIPSDEVKGRIIGREGRNIRHFQQVTGVDVIVDDTPGVVVVSCFDSVRREVAARTLRRLIQDGRVHPARIEELFEVCRKDVEKEITEAGKQIQFEADVHNIHPKAQYLLGRLKFRSSYGQNVYKHTVEVAHIMGMMCSELGLDPKLGRRCGLMHDIGKAIDHEKEGGHPLVGKEFLISIKERPEVIEAAGGHHDQVMTHKYPYVSLAAAADAISAARPGARRESMERYVQRLTALEGVAKSFNGVQEAFAVQAGRELRVLVNAKQVSDEQALVIAREMAQKIEDELTYPGEIKVTLMRETRVTEYAR
ncbi:ribonuclease Y [bacterium]|nr:MAG: ribonuclease Y [bacterium]RIK61556.1 MAG: ribonuclease Y [Planctomycetota bacterium]